MNFKLIKLTTQVSALALCMLSFGSTAFAEGKAVEPVNDTSRGKLLYSLHCISCHNEQVHWLANKKASDWQSLVSQVKLWQNISNLKWDNHDIESVAMHLNTLYYHYPAPNTVARKK